MDLGRILLGTFMLTRALLVVSLAVSVLAAEKAPIAPNLENSAESRSLKKKILETRLLDDMERLDRWTTVTTGS